MTYQLPQREIKFRIRNDGDMIYSDNLRCVYNGYNVIGVSSVPEFTYDGGVVVHRDCPIMQRTGLKDKNGVEIYEGDIVEIYFPEKVLARSDAVDMFGAEPQNNYSVPEGILREKRVKAIVVFLNGRYVYKIISGDCPERPEELKSIIGKNIKTGIKICKKDEVIGNIFENPDLLEA